MGGEYEGTPTMGGEYEGTPTMGGEFVSPMMVGGVPRYFSLRWEGSSDAVPRPMGKPNVLPAPQGEGLGVGSVTSLLSSGALFISRPTRTISATTPSKPDHTCSF